MIRIPIANKICYLANRNIALQTENATETLRWEIDNAQGNLLLSSLSCLIKGSNSNGVIDLIRPSVTVAEDKLLIEYTVGRPLTGAAGTYKYQIGWYGGSDTQNALYEIKEDYFNIIADEGTFPLTEYPTIVQQVASYAGATETAKNQAVQARNTANDRATSAATSASEALAFKASAAADAESAAASKESAEAAAVVATDKAAQATADAGRAENAADAADLAKAGAIAAAASIAAPDIGENHHWIINGVDTGKDSRGANGVGIDRVEIDGGDLIVYFTDDTSANVGHVVGTDGIDGITPVKGVDYFDGEDGEDGAPGLYIGEDTPTDPGIKLHFKPSETGAGTFLHIRWSATEPDSDSDLKTTPDAWVGLCSGATEIAPTAYTAYAWYSWKGLTGAAGAAGRGISSIARTSGTGAAGTTDTYTITFTDSTTTTFNVVNGADGEDGSGSGDMLKSAYDTNNDGVVNDSDKLGGVAASGYAKEISGQAEVSSFALDDYLAMYDTSTSTAKKGSVETLFYKLLSTGNTYLAAGTRANIATLDSLQTVIGKLMKWYADFATVVFTGSYTNLLDKPTSMAPTAHKSTHATGGGDALTAADIGAQATITGGASTITSSNLTASRALASNSSGKVAVSSVTATELGYVSGVTSAIQTQLNKKQASVGSANGILKANGSGTISAATAGTDYASPITITTNTSNTTISITTAADKTVYRYTQGITALAITNNPSTAPWAYRVEFTAGGNFTPSFPAGISWNGGSSFALAACVSGKKYSIIITSHISSFSES